jgi:putative hydrolase of the HAD superfamily
VLPAALVFDFDGLICDTESAEYESIRRVFVDHGSDLALADWLPAVGAAVAPDWAARLEAELGRPVDRDRVLEARRAHVAAMRSELVVLPGVQQLLDAAAGAGIPCGLASNSPRRWVELNLEHLGLGGRFEVIVTVDAVDRPKPDPEPYRTVVEALRAPPAASVGLEDSAIGILSAHRAGLYTVAVPGPMSAHHDFVHADLVVDSMADVTLERLGEGLAARRRP